MKKFSLFLLALLALPAYATPFGISTSELNQLSQDITWHRLLLYNQGKSDIRHAEFFLSKTTEGKVSPNDELIATLSAWEQGQAVACQFPARLHFLKQTLHIDKALPDCPEFQAWYDGINATRLSLVFADEHPNNLAAGFGHAFIKVDNQAGEPIAINYTPNYPAHEHAAVGAYRSLTGHYVGVMEILPFAQKLDDYLVKDKRDLWQFELDLSEDDIGQIIRHLWEVKDMARPYFLTHDNCATEIVRLVDLVRPKSALLSGLGGITTPAKASQLMHQAGFIKQSTHLPSLATTAQAKINQSKQTLTKGNPTTATPMHRLGLSYDYQNNKDMVGVSYRAAYHDVLDRPAGVRSWLDLEILGAKVSYGDKVRLDNLTVVRQRSYNPKNTAYANDGKAAGFELAIRRIGQDNTPAFVASKEQGVSWAVGTGQGGALPDGLCYGLGVAKLAIGNASAMSVGTTLGCVYQFSDKVRAKAEVNLPYWQDKDKGDFVPQANLGVQYDLNRHHAVRLSWQKDKYQDGASIGYQRYF